MRLFFQAVALVALAWLLLEQTACVRAGFAGASGGQDGPSDMRTSGDSTPPDGEAFPDVTVIPDSETNEVPLVDHNSDTCSASVVIDLSAAKISGGRVTFRVDTSKAQRDYPQGCNAAAGWPEVVVRFVNAPSFVLMRCSGGNPLAVSTPLLGTSCEAHAAGAPGGICNVMTCNSSNAQSLNFAQQKTVAIIRRARDAAVARITLTGY